MTKLNLIIEGQDRVGKDTQIALIKRDLYPDYVFQTLHYSKVPFENDMKNIEYSERLYHDMFNLMETSGNNFIANRSHIGEMVYAPMYRGYSGDYVLEIERAFSDMKDMWDNLCLITLVNHPKYIIHREDGDSLSKMDEDKMWHEFIQFQAAHEKSTVYNKLIINCKDDSIDKIHGQIMNFIDRVINPSFYEDYE